MKSLYDFPGIDIFNLGGRNPEITTMRDLQIGHEYKLDKKHITIADGKINIVPVFSLEDNKQVTIGYFSGNSESKGQEFHVGIDGDAGDPTDIYDLSLLSSIEINIKSNASSELYTLIEKKITDVFQEIIVRRGFDANGDFCILTMFVPIEITLDELKFFIKKINKDQDASGNPESSKHYASILFSDAMDLSTRYKEMPQLTFDFCADQDEVIVISNPQSLGFFNQNATLMKALENLKLGKSPIARARISSSSGLEGLDYSDGAARASGLFECMTESENNFKTACEAIIGTDEDYKRNLALKLISLIDGERRALSSNIKSVTYQNDSLVINFQSVGHSLALSTEQIADFFQSHFPKIDARYVCGSVSCVTLNASVIVDKVLPVIGSLDNMPDKLESYEKANGFVARC